mmetsp:Transcript_57161/g.136250  ORF Transcript_57161/g.136250 Transcript_57161/m.136250 type:complete len:115 (+) Transcript_57161:699-1043(+)
MSLKICIELTKTRLYEICVDCIGSLDGQAWNGKAFGMKSFCSELKGLKGAFYLADELFQYLRAWRGSSEGRTCEIVPIEGATLQPRLQQIACVAIMPKMRMCKSGEVLHIPNQE